MPTDEAPHETIARLARERATRSDGEILAELASLEPFPDEDLDTWDPSSPEGDALWDRAYLYAALGDIARERKLRGAARLLLERACHGDPGEMMRVLRHTLEAIFEPDWRALADVCLDLCDSPRAGTRLWAVDQLAVLREPTAEAALRARLDDESPLVREDAQRALKMLGVA